MKKKDTLVRSSMSIPAILTGLAFAVGIYMYHNQYTPQYSSGISHKVDKEDDDGYSGMSQYFFNARKNPSTNKMDYNAMTATEIAVQKMRELHRTAGGLGLNWKSMGPGNIGGRTRSIIFDNQDKSGNTMFVGAVSGGVWKSTNLAATWDSVNDNMGSLSIGCMTQDINGVIYAGTGEGFNEVGYPDGEGFSSGILGNGVYKSTDDGKTFTLIPATAPSISNNQSANWAYTNRLAVSPLNTQVVYAATNGGLMVSINGGTTFSYATNSVTSGVLNGGIALDVKISNDGTLIVACVNGTPYYAYPNSSNNYQQTKFTPIKTSGYGAMASASSDGRIEFGISPTNPNYVYAAVVTEFDTFIGIYMTKTAVTSGNGGTWYDIGPGGSLSFNPYAVGTVQGQGSYDNTIGVSPWNPGLCFFGGTTLWSWQQSTAADTTGTWKSLTTYYGGIGDPTYIHPDMHQIVFDPANPVVMFVGCDGGIYRKLDTVPSAGWEAQNRNYDVTQFYSIACAPNIAPNGEGIIGGTQDNGSPYTSGYQFYWQDGVDLGGGDGGGAYISSLNPNAYYVSADFNTLLRGSSLSGYGSPSNAYTSTKGLNKGANIDSAGPGSGCFVNPLAVYENPYDTMTPDSMLWIADGHHNAGDIVYPISNNGNIPFAYKLKDSVHAAGDSVIVPNYVVSKVAAGFNPNTGVWIMMQGADFQDPAVWMPIGGPKSLPDAFTGTSAVHCMAWSPDGDALFVGSESGQVFRFSNLNKIRDTSYTSGALFSCPNAKAPVANPGCPVVSTNLGAFVGVADVLSISVDPKNGNNVIVTTGGYTGGTHVYFSSNALAASPTFTAAQGNLPEMPVYGSVCDIINSGNSNTALVATEHGVYTTNNITAGSPSWTLDNAGMANTIVCAVRQQTLPPWQCNNSGDIYLGTHGRGAWVDNTFFIPTGIKSVADATSLKVNMNVYPNPMNAGGTVSFNLPTSEKVTLTIYNISGQMIKQIPADNDAIGMHYMTVSTQDMPVGTYLATLTGTDFRQTTRFIVAR